MAYEIHTALLLVVCYVLLQLVRWIYSRHQAHGIFRKHGIPGPKPNFLMGNVSALKADVTPNDVVSKWLKEYGNVFGYFIGEVPYMIVNDQEMIKEITIKEFSKFPNRADMFIKYEPLIHTLIALRDQRWKKVRGVLTPTFSTSKIKKMTKTVNEKISISMEIIHQKAKDKEDFDIYQLVQGLTLDIIADCALAMQVNCQQDLEDPFLIAVQQFFLSAHSKAVDFAIMFPFLRHVLKFLANLFTAGQMTSIIVDNVNKAIKHRRNNASSCRNDILQLMLDASEQVSGNGDEKAHSGVHLTDVEIVANAYIALLAGYETTATALAFTMYLLIQHQDVQERLYEEISESCATSELTYDVVHSLRYLDQVLSESLRMYPPVTGFIARQCRTTCTIGNYTIPEGTVVQVPIWDIHHDPEFWPDPWTFNPERFSPDNKPNISNTIYFPFGIGPRNCIGMRFAMLEAKLTLARLIREFKFIPCDKTDVPLTLRCPTVITNPANGVFLKAVSRAV